MLFKPQEQTQLDKEIDLLLLALRNHEVDSKDYGKIVKRLDVLQKIRNEEERPEKLSKNTMLTTAASILGIILITWYEHEHVVSSKAIGFIPKAK